MKKSTLSKVLLGAAFAGTMFASSGSAMAACVYSEWTNVLPGQALPTITSRICDADISVNVIGADPSGQTYDFGWAEAAKIGTDSFSTEFVDANATNKMQMNILPVLNSMHVMIETVLASGDTTNWTADYVLTRTY